MSVGLKKKHNQQVIEDVDYKNVDERSTNVASSSSYGEGHSNSGEAFNLDNFDLKSEFYETNVSLPDIDENAQDEVTTIAKVFHDGKVETVNLSELSNLLKSQQEVQKVVIEKISIKEATRVSFLFEPSWEGGEENPLIDYVSSPKIVDKSDHSVSHKNQEYILNSDFLSDSNIEEVKETIENLEEPKARNVLKFNNPVVKDEDSTELEQNEVEAKHVVETQEVQEQDSEEVVVETKEVEQSSGIKLSLRSEGPKERNLQYTKQTLTRKKSQSYKSYYYRAKDHMELFKVGSSYMRDYKSGLKNFSFSSFGLKEAREKTVFGICSYFNYHSDVDVCIVTSEYEESFYKEYVGYIKADEDHLTDEKIPFDVTRAKGFDVVEYAAFKKAERQLKENNLEDLIDDLLTKYDVVLWDLPEMGVLDSNKEVYFPIIRTIDNVSFIIGQDRTKNSDIHTLLNYYKRYQVPVKGLLFNPLDKGGKK
ncbi:MAG: hypothetical protein GY909_07010 [Oligoflexia bacterium]|nr:hypothetical protein [Oligoflexia bacterium]